MTTASPSSPLARVRSRRHRVLVCLDGSPLSEMCLPYAIPLAKTFDSVLTLLHVMRPPQERTRTTDAIHWEIARQEARAYLDRSQRAAALALGRPVETRLEQGHPAERIVDVGRALDADLTVLGSHGEAGITAWSLGSTVQQVLAVTRGSVFVARPASATPVSITPKRILVPLDGSRRTESILPTAARLASAYGAALELVHVVQEPVASGVLRAGEELELARRLSKRLESSAALYLDSLRARIAGDVPVSTRVARHPNERRRLLELSQGGHVDLVLVTAHGTGCDPTRSHGSVTAHLLTHSVVPLLVLQDLAEAPDSTADVAEQVAPPLRASFATEAV